MKTPAADIDDRVLCIECGNLKRGWCTDPRRAGLAPHRDAIEVGQQLATMRQRCPAFVVQGATR